MDQCYEWPLKWKSDHLLSKQKAELSEQQQCNFIPNERSLHSRKTPSQLVALNTDIWPLPNLNNHTAIILDWARPPSHLNNSFTINSNSITLILVTTSVDCRPIYWPRPPILHMIPKLYKSTYNLYLTTKHILERSSWPKHLSITTSKLFYSMLRKLKQKTKKH